MALEDYAPGVATDGTGLVLFVPEGGIADLSEPTADELNAPDVVRLTYSLIPGGFNVTTTENEVDTGRYTGLQELSLAGTIKDVVEMTYVTTQTSEDVARNVLKPGTRGTIVHREAVANEIDPEDGQLVTTYPGYAGVQRTVPATKNTEWQKIQKWAITGTVWRDVPIGGGS